MGHRLATAAVQRLDSLQYPPHQPLKDRSNTSNGLVENPWSRTPAMWDMVWQHGMISRGKSSPILGQLALAGDGKSVQHLGRTSIHIFRRLCFC